MLRKIVLQFFVVPIIIFLVTGCEKDKITAPFSVKTGTSAKLLLYLEEEGDIINKILLPVIQAEEVFNNLNNYLVIDLRDSSDFLKGHIEGAKNIPNDSLFNYIRTNYTRFSKVVLISASGQSAAYYSALTHLAGFTNIYYMNYGMASWNIFFSSVWTERLSTYPDPGIFTHTYYQKRNYSHLPETSLNLSSKSMKDFVQERADALIKEGFNEDFNSASSKSALTFNYWININPQFYLICTGPVMLYSSNPYSTNTYHPIGAVFYQVPPDPSDFRSVSYLQTLPSDSSIAVYSGTGQESAFYTAYLRLLGYDARSVLFGMNNIDYSMLSHAPEIIPYAFKTGYIMNYPYVTGSRAR
jgi:rhodanese-related sulfurtransferase